MDGLKPGRIVYYVFSEQAAKEVMRRRTTGASIAQRIHDSQWPMGAQAHIGSEVMPGDVCPAMVVRVLDDDGVTNLKVQLDGSDEYWATRVPFDPSKAGGTWTWIE